MIIKPKVKTVKHIEIDLDVNGQAEVKGQNLVNGGPLHPVDVAMNLLQIAIGLLGSSLVVPKKPNGEIENVTNQEASD